MSVTVQKLSADASGPESPPERVHAPELLVALTNDPALQEALQAVVPAQALVLVADEAALAVQLLNGRVGVVVLDTAASLEAARLSQLAQRLRSQLPDLTLIAAGDTGEQTALANLVTAGTIYRFLHKPVSAQRVKLFVDAAWRRRENPASASGSYPALKLQEPQRSGPGTGLIAAAIVGLVAIVGAGVWLSWRARQATPVPVARQASVKSAASVAQPAAAPAPVQPSAAAVTQMALDKVATAAEQALLAGNYAEAQRLTEAARAIDPNHVRVAFLTAQLAKLRARTAGRSKQPGDSAAAQAAAAEDAGRGAPERRREADAAAVTPASAPAAAAGPGVSPGSRSGTPAGTPAAGSAPAATLAAATGSNVRTGAGAAAQRPAAAPEQASAGSQPGTAGAGAGAAAAASPQPRPAPTIGVKKIYSVEPEYPLAARELNLTGTVDLEFTVRADGTVADVIVTHAQPKGVFDKSAMSAVRQWRYRPAQRDGHPVDQRARVRLRFAYQ